MPINKVPARAFGNLLLKSLFLSATLVAAVSAQVKVLHPGFTLVNIRPATLHPDVSGMDFLPDGSLAVCTWGGDKDSLETPSKKGKLYLLHGVTGDQPNVTVETIATGLEEPLGLKVVGNDIYVSEREGLWRFSKTGDAWARNGKVTDAPGAGTTRSEWFYGLEYRDGFFYANLALGFKDGGDILVPQPHPHRGTTVKIALNGGAVEYLAGGFRTHDGMTMDPAGEIYVTDNEGEWLPSCNFIHVVAGRNYGVKPAVAPFDKATPSPPTVWIPYNRISKSTSQPIYIKDGPYAGQFFVGDVVAGGLSRIFLEKVNGEDQGVVFSQSQGLEAGSHRMVWGPDGDLYVGGCGSRGWTQGGKLNYGLQKLKMNGKVVQEMLAVRARKGGMEIQFSKQLGASAALAASYEVKMWQNIQSPGYGAGNEANSVTLPIQKVQVGADGKNVFLALPGLKAGYVVYIHLLNTPAADGEKPVSAEAFYTLNNLGASDPLSTTEALRVTAGPAMAWTAAPAGRGRLRVRAPGISTYSVTVYDHSGALLAKAEGGETETLLSLPESAAGACLVRVQAGRLNQSRLVVIP
jgi:hypothetical protein